MPDEQNKPSQSGSPFEMVTTSRSKKISPKSLVIVAAVLLFLGISVFLGVYLVQQRQNTTEKAAPATTMYISPSSQSQAPGANFTFSVDVDTATNAVTGVDVRLTYDPSAIQIISLARGAGVANLDQTINNTFDNTAGKISFAIFTLDRTKAVTGTGVEVLKVNAIVASGTGAGSYPLTFDPASAASASQEGQNVLVSKTQGTLTVTGGGGATSTPVPTNTPTPTAGATSTATPTATANATATATATATTVSSNQTASPTQTPMPIPVTGTDWTTYLGLGLGACVVVASIFLAL